MTLQEKFDSARALLEAHNSTLEDGDETVDTESVLKKVRKNGGTSEARLAKIKWEDLENWGVPTLLAREVAEIFRGGPEVVPTAAPTKVVIEDPVHQAENATPKELVEKYNPEFATNPFGKKLKEISGSQRFIVFNNDGSVNVPVSQTLLQELLDSYPERQSVVVEGNVHQTYAVGDRPSRYADENPVYPGQLLRPDGTSDKGCAWAQIPLNVRQILHIAVKDTHELITGKYEEQDLFDLVSGKTFEAIAKRYQKAALRFKELSDTNQLPQLKLKLGGPRDSSNKPNNPFTTAHRVW